MSNVRKQKQPIRAIPFAEPARHKVATQYWWPPRVGDVLVTHSDVNADEAYHHPAGAKHQVVNSFQHRGETLVVVAWRDEGTWNYRVLHNQQAGGFTLVSPRPVAA